MIIDIHCHYTTEPLELHQFRDKQLAGLADPARKPKSTDLGISDEMLVKSVEPQLQLQKLRGSDLTILSPRAAGMAHHVGSEALSKQWARISNDLIHRICTLLPNNFAGVGQLPQFPGVYEKLCELDVPAMIHVSSCCNPNFHHTGAHYINADTAVFMQLIQGNLFKDFPTLKLIIPHGGGAVPYHWGRYRGLCLSIQKTSLAEHVMNNVYFDTCVYHRGGIELLTNIVPTDNILFASEMLGAVPGIDPETGHHFDDTKRYIDQATGLDDQRRSKIFEGNARLVYPRLNSRLNKRQPPRNPP
jgi:4-oxalmesaconate hydratase